MNVLQVISSCIIPTAIFGIILYGLTHIHDIFDVFTSGAKSGLELTLQILPTLVGLMVAISMLRASGAIDLLANWLSPVLTLIGLPADVLPLTLLRPISGSASLGIVTDIIKTHGPDSYAGRLASVMMGSTETTFYTVAVYYGCIGIKDIRHTIKAALTADAAGMLASILVCRFYFGYC